MKIIVDYAKCTGLGICESLAPEYFEVNDDGDLELLNEQVDPDDMSEVEEAVAGCPTFALRLAGE